MIGDLWERAARIVCTADLAKASGIDAATFAVELRKRYPTEDALREMWARTTESMPALARALDDRPMICPHCGRYNEAYSGVTTPAGPKPGDVSMCIGCGNWAIFEDDGMRKPNEEEREWLAEEDTCIKVREAWEQTIAEHGRPPHVGRH
jgi:hypothetical protein